MKKAVGITAGVVIVLAAGWLGATWYTGKRIESEAPAQLATVNKELADALAGMGFTLTIQQLDHERGFFTSRARYSIALAKAPGGPEDLPEGAVEVVSDIEHGPFPKRAIAGGHLLPKLAFVHAELAATENLKPLFELTKGTTPLWSDTVVSYNGDSVGTAGIAPIEVSREDGSLKFSGAHAEGRFVRASKNSIGHITIGQVTLDASKAEAPIKLDMSGLNFDFDTRMGQFGFGIGSSNAKIDRFGFEDIDTGAKIALQGLAYTAALTENGANINLEAGYQIGQINVNGNDFGKGQATLKMERLDGKAAAELSKLYRELVANMSEDGEDVPLTDEQRQQALQQVKQLLAGNPSLRLDPFVWQTGKGESRVTLAVDLAKPAEGDAAAAELPDAVREAIKAIDLKVTLSKPMLQDLIAQYMQGQGLEAQEAATEASDQVGSLAGMAEMLNIGKNDGDNIVGTFHYADGTANLNGQAIPADELFENLLGGLATDEASEADGAAGQMLGAVDPAIIGGILDETGVSYETEVSESGIPFIKIDPTDTGASSVRVDFNDCDEASSSCSDLMLRAVVASARPIPLARINDWNTRNRWTRAYLEDNKNAVLEMDVNAYGGIGGDSASYLVGTFLTTLPAFAEVMTAK
ncbi:DUF945 family protein [Bordetella petrii]|uniref:DUF945 family protein n=1 Tax=Bordetella petrii TaxID=94624 RepID=UPI003730B71F